MFYIARSYIMNNRWLTVYAILGGAGITLLTWLYNSTPTGLLGAAWYGFPFTWVKKLIIAPQYFPWRMAIPAFISDIAIWAIVVGVILVIVRHLRK